MGTAPEPFDTAATPPAQERSEAAAASSPPGARRGIGRRPRRTATGRRTFSATLSSLDDLAASGAKISVRVTDLDQDAPVLAGDDFVTLPIAGLGVVPLLIEVAAAFESRRLDPLEIVDRSEIDPVSVAGVWRRLEAPALPLSDLAVLAASSGDALAANALLARVGLPAVRARIEQLGLSQTALLDGFRDERGPDDAPLVALGSSRELASLFADLARSRVVSASVSSRVSGWLSLDHDLSLVGAATGLDPFSHETDEHGLVFVNKTGRDAGIRVDAGVLAGPRAAVSYALIVCFDDLSIMHRARAHGGFRALGLDLMEYVF